MNYLTEPYKPGQEYEIHRLIKKVYDEFVSGDYSEAGNNFFYDWISPGKIAERQKGSRNIFVAKSGEQIIGIIETRESKNISLLFVDSKYHGKGVAKSLFKAALNNCRKQSNNLNRFYVHASPYSIPVYKKMGFRAADDMQEENGIKYLPMEIDLKWPSE